MSGARIRSSLVLASALALLASAGCSLSRAVAGAGGSDAGNDRFDAAPRDASPGDDAATTPDAWTPIDANVETPDVGCRGPSDCPAQTVGDWSECVFSDTCSENGARQRVTTTYTCESGVCVPYGIAETDACTRTTEGASCGGETCGPCTATAGGNVCAPAGTVMCSSMACQSGSCRAVDEVRSCMPSPPAYCDSPPAWGGCTRIAGRCVRGRSRSTCAFGVCVPLTGYETEDCRPSDC